MVASILPLLIAASSLCPPAHAFTPTRPVVSVPPITPALNLGIRRESSTGRPTQSARGAYNTQQTSHLNMLSSTNEGEGDDKEKKKSVSDKIFWAKQRALAAEMTAKEEAGVKEKAREKFAKRRLALTSDTFYFSILIGCLLWLVSPNPFVTISYLFGALSGTAYSYGLGKYVESIGGSIDDADVEGAGIGQARFAFLILLFVVVGKFRSQGLLEIPSIMGFFTYQLASLGQGLREIDD